MLKRLYIDNFRSLVNFEFTPGPVSALVGLNGTGKSSVFDAFDALRAFVSGGDAVAREFPERSLTAWDTRDVQRFELELEIDSVPYTYSLHLRHTRQPHTVVVEDGAPPETPYIVRSTEQSPCSEIRL